MPRAVASSGPNRGLNHRSGANGPNKPPSRGGKDKKIRAALEEITNATTSNEKSLKNQVKKGLSNIVRRSSSKSTSSASTTQRKSNRKRKSNEDTTNSLPSSQEEESVKKLIENFVHQDDSDSEEAFHSASEGDEQANRFHYAPPERVLPPPGVFDFDQDNMGDPSTCSEYVADVFQYYKEREKLFYCKDYMATQPEISEMMRAILVDWLVEVQESFELNHEALYTAVKLMDLYLSKVKVSKEELQLVGATSCLIACKVDERIPPNLDDFVYVCDNAYSRRDIVRKELHMFSVANYDIGYPLSYRFLRRYGRACRINMPDLTLARFILELSLMDYQFNVETSESLLAAATLALALKIKELKDWEKPFLFYTGYTFEEVHPLFQKLLVMMQKPPNEHTKTIRLKYSHRTFFEVANITIPKSIDLGVRIGGK